MQARCALVYRMQTAQPRTITALLFGFRRLLPGDLTVFEGVAYSSRFTINVSVLPLVIDTETTFSILNSGLLS